MSVSDSSLLRALLDGLGKCRRGADLPGSATLTGPVVRRPRGLISAADRPTYDLVQGLVGALPGL